MKRLLALLFILCGISAHGYDVFFSTTNFDSQFFPQYSRKVLVTPIMYSNSLGTLDPKMYQTGGASDAYPGGFWISNMLSGQYTFQAQPPPAQTRWSFRIQSGSGSYVLTTSDLIATPQGTGFPTYSDITNYVNAHTSAGSGIPTLNGAGTNATLYFNIANAGNTNYLYCADGLTNMHGQYYYVRTQSGARIFTNANGTAFVDDTQINFFDNEFNWLSSTNGAISSWNVNFKIAFADTIGGAIGMVVPSAPPTLWNWGIYQQPISWIGFASGDSRYLTNIDGGNVISGTIPHSAFTDSNYTNALAVAPVSVFAPPAGFFTISNNPNLGAAGTNGMSWRMNLGINNFEWRFLDDAGHGSGGLFINRGHGGHSYGTDTDVEWQWDTPGSWALGLGYGYGGGGHLQFGIGGVDAAHQWGGHSLAMYHMLGATFTNGHSGAITFTTSVGNGTGADIQDFQPGFVAQVTQTNSTPINSQYELDIFPHIDPTLIAGDAWDCRMLMTNGVRFIWSGIGGNGPTNAAFFDMPIVLNKGITFAGTTNPWVLKSGDSMSGPLTVNAGLIANTIANANGGGITGTFIGDATSLTNIPAGKLTGIASSNNIPGLNASNLVSGTIQGALLPTSLTNALAGTNDVRAVYLTNNANFFGGVHGGNGGSLTNISGSTNSAWVTITMPSNVGGVSYFTNTAAYSIFYAVKGTTITVGVTNAANSTPALIISASTQAFFPMAPGDVAMVTNASITGAQSKKIP